MPNEFTDEFKAWFFMPQNAEHLDSLLSWIAKKSVASRGRALLQGDTDFDKGRYSALQEVLTITKLATPKSDT